MAKRNAEQRRMLPRLTTRQYEALQMIERCSSPPTILELSQQMGISQTAVMKHVRELGRKRYLQSFEGEKGRTRAIVPVPVWWRVSGLVNELVRYLIDEGRLVTAEDVYDLLKAPSKFHADWLSFCEHEPNRVARLQKRFQWRDNLK